MINDKNVKAKFLAILFALLVNTLAAQVPPAAHPEMITAHLNTTFFLAGETLYFQIYCLDAKTGKLSPLSKVAYAELVGSDGKPLARMKVSLDHGVGSGDFFFHGNVPSGNYTFVAYTRWMRNFGEESFFRSSVTVINPQLRPSPENRPSLAQKEQPALPDQNVVSGFSMRLSKNTFATRELVELALESDDSVMTALSVSVRVSEPDLRTANPWVAKEVPDISPVQEVKFIPDFRSEFVTGTIREKKDNKPYAGKLITLSAPSRNFGFAVSTTDASGRYYFNVPQTEGALLLLGIQGHQASDFEINHDDGFLTDHSLFSAGRFEPDSTLIPLIARRYLPMQIENAFYSAKRDSAITSDNHRKFFSTPERRYRLDDFTRFSTMDDVFRELIPEVVVKIRDGAYSLVLVNSATGFRFDTGPLVLIDGIPVQDPNTLMKYDPSLIKTIDLVTQRYYYGGLAANGIVSIETYDGNAKDLPVQDLFRVDYVAPQGSKLYYEPRYDSGDSLARIPDFRTQLFWKPRCIVNSSDKLTFFTGDLAGTYEVEVVGVNGRGEKIWLRKEFEVIDSSSEN